MLDELKLNGFEVPSVGEVIFGYISKAIEYSYTTATVFDTNFIPNANQKRLDDLIKSSTVPKNQHLHILIHGDVGSGKTWAALRYVMKNMLEFAGVKTLCVRRTVHDIQESIYSEACDFLRSFGIGYRKNDKDMTIRLDNLSYFTMRSDKSLVQAHKNKSDALGSQAFSQAILEEADSISEELADTLPGRMRQKIPGFRKIIFYICNPPGRNHWIYRKFFEEADPNDPASPYRAIYMPMEGNMSNLDPGYVASVDRDYAKNPALYNSLRRGQFSPDVKGDPIYRKYFNSAVHVSKEKLEWNKKYPIIRCWDFGHRGQPCVFMQDDRDRKQIRFFNCKMVQKELFQPFLTEIVSQYSPEHFPDATFVDVCDPAGEQQTGHGLSYCDLMRAVGLHPKYTKATVAYGVGVVAEQLQLMTSRTTSEFFQPSVKPAILIDSTRDGANLIVEMFESGYCNKKEAPRDVIDPVKDGYYDHVADAIRYGILLIRRAGGRVTSSGPSALRDGWTPMDGPRKGARDSRRERAARIYGKSRLR